MINDFKSFTKLKKYIYLCNKLHNYYFCIVITVERTCRFLLSRSLKYTITFFIKNKTEN